VNLVEISGNERGNILKPSLMYMKPKRKGGKLLIYMEEYMNS
jgi:hypothetical protein